MMMTSYKKMCYIACALVVVRGGVAITDDSLGIDNDDPPNIYSGFDLVEMPVFAF